MAKKSDFGKSWVEEAPVAKTNGNGRGRIRKLLVIDKAAKDEGSKQIPEDKFSKELYSKSGLVKPPFDLEQLVWLAEMHPVHAACLEQRASDVVGGGWRWENLRPDAIMTPSAEAEVRPESDDRGRPATDGRQIPVDPEDERVAASFSKADEAQLAIEERFSSLAGEHKTMIELLHEAWLDYETCGVGFLELARDDSGTVTQLFHVPAHTIRAHADGIRYAQQRGKDIVWFVEWGTEAVVDSETGDITSGKRTDKSANELLVFKKTTRRSDYYGIPNYVSAIGWIMLALAARDYNINFFRNLREPRWAIILSNLEGDDEVQEALEQAFTVDLASPHRNLMASFEGDAKVHFEKLSEDQNEASFVQLLDKCDKAILVAHRMPSDRIGMIQSGPLGGSVADAANRVYREGVVLPDQEILNHRLNLFIEKELGNTDFALKLIELDTKAEKNDLTGATTGFRSGIYSLNEARARAGLPPVTGDTGGQFIWNLGGVFNPKAIKSFTDEDLEQARRLNEIDQTYGG